MRSKQPEFQSERVMGEVCLGVAVAGVETLIAIAIAILLYRGPPQLAASFILMSPVGTQTGRSGDVR